MNYHHLQSLGNRLSYYQHSNEVDWEVCISDGWWRRKTKDSGYLSSVTVDYTHHGMAHLTVFPWKDAISVSNPFGFGVECLVVGKRMSYKFGILFELLFYAEPKECWLTLKNHIFPIMEKAWIHLRKLTYLKRKCMTNGGESRDFFILFWPSRKHKWSIVRNFGENI